MLNITNRSKNKDVSNASTIISYFNTFDENKTLVIYSSDSVFKSIFGSMHISSLDELFGIETTAESTYKLKNNVFKGIFNLQIIK